MSDQFTLISEIGAKTRFDIASATVILAPAAGFSKPLIGCSPIDVADPVYNHIGCGKFVFEYLN